MSSSYSFAPAPSPADWDAFVSTSPQASPFCCDWFLSCYADQIEYWFLKDDSGDVLAGAPILRGADSNSAVHMPFAMYVGPLLGQATSNWPIHKSAKHVPDILEALVLHLLKHCDQLALSCHPNLADLRGIQWLPYSEQFSGSVSLDLRYTARMSIPDQGELPVWLQTVRNLRRREVKRSQKAGNVTGVIDDISRLLDLYTKTFARQGIDVPEDHLVILGKLADRSLSSGCGAMTAITDRDGHVRSAYFFLTFLDTAYYLVAGNDPTQRGTGTSSHLLFDSMHILRRMGMRWLDFCGANSPNRGDFKTSFNAELITYFDAVVTR